MEQILIPGYFDLYGDRPTTYEQIVSQLPSEVLIISAAALNDELYERQGDPQVQAALIQRVAARFSLSERQGFAQRLKAYRVRSGFTFSNVLFDRIVFLELITHEIHRNAQFELTNDSPQQEVSLLKAYLLTVDRLHLRNSLSYKRAIDAPEDEHTLYREIWVPMLYQYQYNDYPFGPYHYYKLTAFLLYNLHHQRAYLREYLHARGVTRISELMNSFYQLTLVAARFNTEQFLPGLKYVKPLPGIDTKHLNSMTINREWGKPIDLNTLKRFPLYLRKERGYVILDRGLFYRKIYLGPYFELFYDTILSSKMDFNEYSGTIAKDVIEEICFKHILEEITHPAGSLLVFDMDGPKFPDGYYRYGSHALLFEMKAYILKDALPDNPDFDTFKAYLDSRFINGDGKKKKGIGQLCQQLELLARGQAPFDRSLSKDLAGEKLTVYPIICFDDFNFSLPGINDYLAKRLQEMVSEAARAALDIRPLVLVNLDILFRFASGKGSFDQVRLMLDQYLSIIKARHDNYRRTNDRNLWLQSISSLDEVFHMLIFDRVSKGWRSLQMKELLAKQYVTQELLDTVV
jgi:hypothetical protein